MRSYRQHCSLARSLDLLGERWTLLIVRELMLGPVRFRDLLDNLPGIGTNLLSTRLKALAAAGIVHRDGTTYALAERGEALRPMIEEMAIWGFGLMPERPGEGELLRPSWAALAMRAVMLREGPPPAEGLFAFDVGGDRFWVRTSGDRADVRRGPAPVPPDASLRMDVPSFFALVTGAGELPAEAVEGDRRALQRLLKAFRLPTPERPGASASRGRAA